MRETERERINALLREGLNSGPPGPMTDEDWEFIQREARRLGERRQAEREASRDLPNQ
jgi:hypothetical protein